MGTPAWFRARLVKIGELRAGINDAICTLRSALEDLDEAERHAIAGLAECEPAQQPTEPATPLPTGGPFDPAYNRALGPWLVELSARHLHTPPTERKD